MTERLLTAREISEILGVSIDTLQRWYKAGEVPSFKLADGNGPVRFRLSEVEAWLESRRRGGPKVAA